MGRHPGRHKAKMGLLMDYPRGVPDHFEYCLLEAGKPPTWQALELEGSWFPDAFIGTMGSLMRYKEGSSNKLPTSVEDVIKTMAVVEKSLCLQRWQLPITRSDLAPIKTSHQPTRRDCAGM